MVAAAAAMALAGSAAATDLAMQSIDPGTLPLLGDTGGHLGGVSAALDRLSRTIAVAHAAENIRSNLVMPGLAGRVASAADLSARRAAAPPVKRQGSSWDVAEAALFLASAAAGDITFAELVDGGLTLTVPAA